MDGGSAPIRDGDWLVMRFARGRPIAALEGKVALVQITSRSDSLAFQVKRVVRDGEGWELRSSNPQRPSFRASEDTVPIAVLAEVVRPEALAPAVGSRIADEDLAEAFGVSSVPSSGRVDGHLFFKIEDAGRFVEPDRLRLTGPTMAPGETAFVLARSPSDRMWRYCGVARWNDAENAWEVPELDFATWRGLGGIRSVSRRLPQHAMEAARGLCERLIREYGPGEWLGDSERRCRLVGLAKDGGIRIDGGGDGFRERTVSLTDFAWVLAAKEDAARSGGALDEARVNRVRYLEGTPKGSTRWIDTRWALLIVGWLESDRGRRS
jgi:hypothetical protein